MVNKYVNEKEYLVCRIADVQITNKFIYYDNKIIDIKSVNAVDFDLKPRNPAILLISLIGFIFVTWGMMLALVGIKEIETQLIIGFVLILLGIVLYFFARSKAVLIIYCPAETFKINFEDTLRSELKNAQRAIFEESI